MKFRARILYVFITLTAMFVGAAVGSWVVPLGFALSQRGLAGIPQIPRELIFFAHAPSWVMPEQRPALYGALEFAISVFALAGVAMFAFVGHRVWRFVGIDVLGWMTEEDVERFRNERQFF